MKKKALRQQRINNTMIKSTTAFFCFKVISAYTPLSTGITTPLQRGKAKKHYQDQKKR